MPSKASANSDEQLHRERIEWFRTWVPDSDKNELPIPRVLLIGDSIVMGYGPNAAELLKDQVSLAWAGTSRFPEDPVYLEEIKLVLRTTRFDAIHFNNGLHGWDYSEARYATHLERMVRELMAYSPDSKWMLATSTPMRVREQVEQLDDRNERVIERNCLMNDLAQKLNLPLTDLYAAMVDHPEYYVSDGVHYNESGQKAQGKVVADAIRHRLL